MSIDSFRIQFASRPSHKYYIEMSHVCLSKTLCRSLRPVYPRARPVRKSRMPAWIRMLPVPVVRLPWVWEGARLQEISKQLRTQHRRHSLERASHQITGCSKTAECSWAFVRNLLLERPGSSDNRPQHWIVFSFLLILRPCERASWKNN